MIRVKDYINGVVAALVGREPYTEGYPGPILIGDGHPVTLSSTEDEHQTVFIGIRDSRDVPTALLNVPEPDVPDIYGGWPDEFAVVALGNFRTQGGLDEAAGFVVVQVFLRVRISPEAAMELYDFVDGVVRILTNAFEGTTISVGEEDLDPGYRVAPITITFEV